MGAEAVVMSVLVVAGLLATTTIDVRPTWAMIAFTLPIGSALATVGGLFLIVAGARLFPAWVLAATLLPVLAVLVLRRLRISKAGWGWAAVALAVTLGLIVLVYDSGLVNMTADSYRNLSIGALIAKTGSIDVVAPHDLHKRSLVVPLIHSLADLSDNLYLRSFSPMMALSGLGSLIWLGAMALRSYPHRWVRWVALGAGLGLLITNHRFVFNAFYVNGHMTLAVWLMIMVGCAWLVAIGKAPERLLWLSVLVAPALAVIRPESSLLALLALVPIVSSSSLRRRWKAGLLGSTGIAMALWHLVLASAYTARETVPLEIWAMTGVGLCCVVVALMLWFRDLPFPTWTPHIVGGALVVGLAAFGVKEPDIFRNSWSSTVENIVLGRGFHGYSLIVLAALVIGSYLFRRIDQMWMLVFSVCTALPFGFLMAHLRGGSYRVGPGDSLNRMLLHWLPLAVLSLVVMLQSRSARLTFVSSFDRVRGGS